MKAGATVCSHPGLLGTTLRTELVAEKGSLPQPPGVELGGATETSTEPGMDASSPDRSQAAVLVQLRRQR